MDRLHEAAQEPSPRRASLFDGLRADARGQPYGFAAFARYAPKVAGEREDDTGFAESRLLSEQVGVCALGNSGGASTQAGLGLNLFLFLAFALVVGLVAVVFNSAPTWPER